MSIMETMPNELQPFFKKKAKRGIVTLALGDALYGNLATNLAISLKHAEDMPIALIYTPSAIANLGNEYLSLFSHKILFDESKVLINGVHHWHLGKMFLGEYTPFEKTIFLDADTMWNNKASLNGIFDELNGMPTVFQTKGSFNRGTSYTFWGDARDIMGKYGINDIPCTYGGFIYFENDDILQKAKEIYLEQPAIAEKWATGIPDEFCFNVALALTGQTTPDYEPIYFPAMHGGRNKHQIEQYDGFTVSGNMMGGQLKMTYEHWAKMYAHWLKLPYIKVWDKRDTINERKER